MPFLNHAVAARWTWIVRPGGEMTVSWPNQPARIGAISSSTSGSEQGWRSWSVTAQVAGMYDDGAAHGFVVFDQVENAPCCSAATRS